MMHTFPELRIGGVMIAPFVSYNIAALVTFLLLRPLLKIARFESLFLSAPLALFSLYVVILACFIVLL